MFLKDNKQRPGIINKIKGGFRIRTEKQRARLILTGLKLESY